VIDGTARGVFQGKILVRRDAQKTDGHQLNKALLLSQGAEIDSKPELEIYADDVKCGHGATAGELDDNALFYLRSRGIDAETARGLLVDAFVGEAIEQIEHEAARTAFRRVVDGWLAEGRADKQRDRDGGR
jgi:Fe-S cluster assembly protein SufD